jgi:hypothetical protein
MKGLMKFILLLKKGLKLLLSKYLILLLLVILISGCEKKNGDMAPPVNNNMDNSEELIKGLNSILKSEVNFALKGNFSGDSTQQVVTGTEILTKKEWGIKFHLFEVKDNKPEKKNDTKLLDGSFKDCRVEKLNISGIDNDLIYYNSLNYFMGSAGGEIFSYIIDFKIQKTYYAHLVSEPGKPVLLFLSGNNNQEINGYFTSTFKKDFPAFKIVSKDQVLN